MSPRYVAYGAGLESAIGLPELAEDATKPVKWRFTPVSALPEATGAAELGAENLYADVHARLVRHAAGHRISIDDTGTFDIDASGRTILFQSTPTAWPEFVRAHLVGRVLATTLFLDGWLPLHASAVACRDGVVAFIAPKGFGKSTIASALSSRGARLVTDDTLPIEPANADGATPAPTRAWPGVHSMRMRPDTAAALGFTGLSEGRDGKVLLRDLPSERLLTTPAPLVSLYVLEPVRPGETEPTREALSPTLAALLTVAHVKVGRMLGPAAAGVMLDRAARLAAAVPVRRLRVPRDLGSLPAIAARILEWHGGAA